MLQENQYNHLNSNRSSYMKIYRFMKYQIRLLDNLRIARIDIWLNGKVGDVEDVTNVNQITRIKHM